MYRGTFIALGVAPNSETTGLRRRVYHFAEDRKRLQRNRVRRRLREIVRINQTALRPNIWLVAMPVRCGAGDYRALEDEWLRLASALLS